MTSHLYLKSLFWNSQNLINFKISSQILSPGANPIEKKFFVKFCFTLELTNQISHVTFLDSAISQSPHRVK